MLLQQERCCDHPLNLGSAYGYCLGNPVLGIDPSGFRVAWETGSRETDAALTAKYSKKWAEEAASRRGRSSDNPIVLSPGHPSYVPFLGLNYVDVSIPWESEPCTVTISATMVWRVVFYMDHCALMVVSVGDPLMTSSTEGSMVTGSGKSIGGSPFDAYRTVISGECWGGWSAPGSMWMRDEFTQVCSIEIRRDRVAIIAIGRQRSGLGLVQFGTTLDESGKPVPQISASPQSVWDWDYPMGAPHSLMIGTVLEATLGGMEPARPRRDPFQEPVLPYFLN